MTFAIVNVATPPPWTVEANVSPVALGNIPEAGDVVRVIRGGLMVKVKVRWVVCPRTVLFPEQYPKVDKIIAGVFE